MLVNLDRAIAFSDMAFSLKTLRKFNNYFCLVVSWSYFRAAVLGWCL